MSNKFLGSSGSNANVSDGSTILFGSTIGAASLDSSKAVKTNSLKQLISTNLDIADVNSLQSELNGKASADQDLNTTDSVIFDGITSTDEVLIELNNGAADSTVFFNESNGPNQTCRTAIDGGTPFALLLAKSRGTIAAPTAVLLNDDLSLIISEGQHSSGVGNVTQSTRIQTKATENFDASSAGSSMIFKTTDNTTIGSVEKLKLDTDGVTMNTGVNSILFPDTRGTDGQIMVMNSSGEMEWGTVANTISESTGVFSGGIISENAGMDTTLFDISAGTGQIVDGSNVTQVSWGDMLNENGNYVTLQTYVLINSSGVIVKSSTKPSNSDLRDNIQLGVIISIDGVNINAVSVEQMFLGNTTNQISDLASALGKINTSGNVMSASTLLTVAKSTGTMYSFGSNVENNNKNPSNVTTGVVDTNGSQTFGYFYQDGSASGPISSVIPGEYDDGNGQGSPGTVTSQRWQTQRIYLFPEGNIILLPGQATYSNLADAKAAINSEAFNTLSNIASNGLLIAYLFLRGGASDLGTTPGDAEFLQAARISGGSGAVAGGDLNGPVLSLDNSICRFDGVSGKLIQDTSGALLQDSGMIQLMTTGVTIPALFDDIGLLIGNNNDTNAQIQFITDATTSAVIRFGHETDSNRGSISFGMTSDDMNFVTAGVNRMKIDSTEIHAIVPQITYGTTTGGGGNTVTLAQGRGTNGQVLTTDGAGATSWTTPSNPFDQDLDTTEDVQFQNVQLGSSTLANSAITITLPAKAALDAGHVVKIVNDSGTAKVGYVAYNDVDGTGVAGVTVTSAAINDPIVIAIGGVFTAVVEDTEFVEIGEHIEKSDTFGQDGRVYVPSAAGLSAGVFAVALTSATGNVAGTNTIKALFIKNELL